ncbi:MAG: hypothetical protein JXA78_08480 [Anaerolineales bacterium]|nr:hypothetical protein [Anaerolineales bacterium]
MTEIIYCRIRVQGHLPEDWADWFAGLQLENLPGGEMALSGALPDQSALCGALNRVQNLGLKVLLITCIRAEKPAYALDPKACSVSDCNEARQTEATNKPRTR